MVVGTPESNGLGGSMAKRKTGWRGPPGPHQPVHDVSRRSGRRYFRHSPKNDEVNVQP